MFRNITKHSEIFDILRNIVRNITNHFESLGNTILKVVPHYFLATLVNTFSVAKYDERLRIIKKKVVPKKSYAMPPNFFHPRRTVEVSRNITKKSFGGTLEVHVVQ